MHVTYLYALCRPFDGQQLSAIAGIGGAPVRLLRVDDLALAASDVPLADFDTAPLQAHLEDLGWLERTAREHDAVVRALAAATATAPLRMATVCRDDDGARGRLAEFAERARPVLDRLAGRDEWGVKAFATRAVAASPHAATGTEYLRRRRDAQAARHRVLDEAGKQATAVYDLLAAAAVCGVLHRPQDPALSGRTDPMVLNAAFLLEHERIDAFAALVAERDASCDHLRLELTGPWPPYSFAALDANW